jgi:hypothetical protein
MKNLSFTWHTHGVDEGTYQVNATALLLAYETNQTDNSREADPVTILSSLINHDIAVTQIYSPKSCLGEGYPTTINVTIKNEGNEPELLIQVTCCANTSQVGTTLVAILSVTDSETVTFTWNTTLVSKGNYTLRAYATPVLGEIDTTDNTLTSGWILVTIPGDMEGDKDVDLFDIVIMAASYGSVENHSKYVPNADIDGDGDVDIFDVVIAVGNYGKHW